MDSRTLLNRVERFLRQECRIPRGAHLVVGVSGGVDSVVLAHLLGRMDLELTLAHVNHGMRGGESDADEAFVRALGDRWGLPLHVTRLTPAPTSEEEARDGRLRFLSEVRTGVGGHAVALGHHRDDQAETVLLNLLRGAGTSGLAGILPRRGIFVHPMLEIPRRGVLQYCRDQELSYREDSTNRSLQYQRNRVRRQLIPYLEKWFNPSVRKSLSQTADIVRGEEQLTARHAGRLFRSLARPEGFEPGGSRSIEFAGDGFLGQPVAVQRRLLRLAYRIVSGTGDDLGYTAVEDALAVIASGAPARTLHLPAKAVVRTTYDGFTVSRIEGSCTARLGESVLPVGGRLVLGGWMLGCRLLTREQASAVKKALLGGHPPCLVTHTFIDYNKVDLPLRVRGWYPGDRIRPLGMSGEKKLQDLFVDEKIPRMQRDNIPLIISDDNIVWVAGLRLNHDYRVESETLRILHLWAQNDDLWPRSR